MDIRSLTPQLSVAPQIRPEDVAELASAGFRTVVCNRPDAENPPQLQSSRVSDAAASAGLAFHYLPVDPGHFHPDLIARFTQILDDSEGPVLAYCRSGTRSATAWALGQSGRLAAAEILRKAAGAGYDLSGIARALD